TSSSTATSATIITPDHRMWVAAGGWEAVLLAASATKQVTPAIAAAIASHTARFGRRWLRHMPSSTANGTLSTVIGWTTDTGAPLNAIRLSRAPTPERPKPAHHNGRWSRRRTNVID